MTERRTIVLDPKVRRIVMSFRAFLMASGVEIDFSAALNFLAFVGFRNLFKSGFNMEVARRLGDYVSIDEDTKKLVVEEWPKWIERFPMARGPRRTVTKALSRSRAKSQEVSSDVAISADDLK